MFYSIFIAQSSKACEVAAAFDQELACDYPNFSTTFILDRNVKA